MTIAAVIASGLLASACGGATRSASPQPKQPKSGTAGLTSANVGSHAERVLVAERGVIAMVARDGCVSTVTSGTDDTGGYDEMNERCPPRDRLERWFHGVDELTSSVPVRRVSEDEDEDDVTLPAAELITSGGAVLEVVNKSDAKRLVAAVRTLADELGSVETPRPGPASASGWQMVHVSGPAHVYLGGEPTRGVLDVRVSTSGQYLCEFMTNTGDGPLRATKSGAIEPDLAVRAIDEVLEPFKAVNPGEHGHATMAAATAGGAEKRANVASTAAVFERFGSLQDALGDACLPELEPPPPPGP